MTDKTMTLELCPFCGCNENLGRVYSGTHSEYYVQCFDCDARGPVHADDNDACGAWSKRHLSQTAERPCSLSEALNVIEHWGRRGNTLQGDDVARLRALTDKIAPAERGEAVAWLVLDEEGSPSMLFFDRVEALAYCDDDEQPTPLYTTPLPAAGVPDGEVRLWDTQWTNIVNHDNCYRDWDKGEAINHAVKMTELAIARNIADGKLPHKRSTATPSPAIDVAVARELKSEALLRSCKAVCDRVIEQDGGILGGIDFNALGAAITAHLSESGNG